MTAPMKSLLRSFVVAVSLSSIVVLSTSGCALETGAGEGEADDGDDGEDGVEETSQAITTFTSFQRRNLTVINSYRARKGLVKLKLSPKLSSFARAGSLQLSRDHVPHRHFSSAGTSIFRKGFKTSAAENQGDPHGWPVLVPGNPTANRNAQIDDIQETMFDEGPGAGAAHGHYMNMMNPKFRRVGIGLVDVNGKLYLTNDFSQ